MFPTCQILADKPQCGVFSSMPTSHLRLIEPMKRCLFSFALLATLTCRAADDVVFADFEGTDYGAWKTEGEAFGAGPARGALPGQMAVEGFVGKGLVNSFNKGDDSLGTLTSPEFKIERR